MTTYSVLLALVLGSPDPAADLLACPPDVAEPNDTSATAYPITCSPDFTVPVWGICLDPPGDVDFFSVDLGAGQAFTVYLSTSSFRSASFSLYAPDGITLVDQSTVLPGLTPSRAHLASAWEA